MKRMLFLSIVLVAGVFFLAPSASAQDEGPDGPGRKRLEELRKIKLVEALDLSEEQSIKIFARERDFRKRERVLIDKRRQIIAHLRDIGKGSGADGETMKEMTALKDLGIEMVNQRFDYIISLKDILTTRQIAKYIAFEDTFMNEVRSMLKNMGRGRPPRDRE